MHNAAVDRLLDEYQHQGATEQSLGFPIHPMHNLSRENKPKDQISFFEWFIIPFYGQMKVVSQQMQIICHSLESNLSTWKEKLRN